MTSVEFNKIKENINSNIKLFRSKRKNILIILLIMVYLTKEMKVGGILI